MPEVLPEVQDLPAFTHVLTHRDLHLHPVLVLVARRPGRALPRGIGGRLVHPQTGRA